MSSQSRGSFTRPNPIRTLQIYIHYSNHTSYFRNISIFIINAVTECGDWTGQKLSDRKANINRLVWAFA